MLKKALLDLISLGKNKGANRKRSSRIPFRSRLSLEPLEDRRLLAAFDLSGYELYNNFTDLTGTSADDFSGVVYHEPTDSFFIIDNGANTNNGAIFEYEYNSTFTSLVKQREIVFTGFDDPNLPQPNPDSLREGDPEEIVYLGNNKFAFVREQMGIIHEFLIDADGPDDGNVIDGDTNSDGSTDTIDESTVEDQVLTEITMDKNPNDFDGANTNNDNIEGLAYNPDGNFDSIADDPVYYAVKELNWTDIDSPANGNEILYQIDASDGTTTSIDVSGLINELGTSNDASGLAFAGGYLFITSERDANKTQVTRLTRTGSNWAFAGGNDDRFSLSGMPQPEAITFSTDGFDMFIVGENRQFRHYRNYTDFTPNAAPDLHEDSDTGSSNSNNITTDTMPEFTGTLTRTVGGNSVPVDKAWVFLYKDGAPTGDKDETDASGNYSITVGTALALDDYEFTIRVGEKDDTLDERPDNLSIVSAPLDVFIVASDVNGDLTGNDYVDFDDLTTLLANWNKDVSMAQGNLVEPTTTLVDFGDLTVLLTAWTGPGGAPSPEATWVWPGEGMTVYSASIDVYVNFSEEVQGVDASDLELFGLGGIEATIGTPTHIINNVWKFPVSGLLPGAVDVVLAIDEDDITDMAGNSIAPKAWSFVVDPGLWLNEDGTGDVALAADFLGLSSTAVTVEVTFVSDEITSGIGAGTPIFAYATDDEQDAFTLFIENDAPNNMKLYVNGASVVLASGTDVTDLFDGVKYHLAVTYDSDTG
ncbi:MAG: hypothetical protein IID44_32370, partial [Planctomycetes bacterium]|nr:hypothetical protein [Planctomycetota bacterium]